MGRGDEDKEKERKGWGRGKGAGMEIAKEEGDFLTPGERRDTGILVLL